MQEDDNRLEGSVHTHARTLLQLLGSLRLHHLSCVFALRFFPPWSFSHLPRCPTHADPDVSGLTSVAVQ